MEVGGGSIWHKRLFLVEEQEPGIIPGGQKKVYSSRGRQSQVELGEELQYCRSKLYYCYSTQGIYLVQYSTVLWYHNICFCCAIMTDFGLRWSNISY